jgi:hypothetical protein
MILSPGIPVLGGPGTCFLAARPREKPRPAETRRRKESFRNAGFLRLSVGMPPENTKGLADKTPQRERRETRTKRTLKNRIPPAKEENRRGYA